MYVRRKDHCQHRLWMWNWVPAQEDVGCDRRLHACMCCLPVETMFSPCWRQGGEEAVVRKAGEVELPFLVETRRGQPISLPQECEGLHHSPA